MTSPGNTGTDADMGYSRIFGFAAPLDFNIIATGSVGGTPSDSYGSENVETTSVVKLARLLYFANYVKRCERRNRNSDFWIPQIFSCVISWPALARVAPVSCLAL